MVKLSGPGFSLRASGTLAQVLTFNAQPGQTTLRRKPQPKHPRTALQVAVQASLTFLTQQWSALSDNDQASWDHADFVDGVSPYTNYIKHNMQRLRQFDPPTKAYPWEDAGFIASNLTVFHQCLVQHNDIHYQAFSGTNQQWGIIVLRQLATPPPELFDNIVAILPWQDLDPHVWTDSPLEPVTYRYVLWRFTDTGRRANFALTLTGCQTLYD